MCLLKLVQWLFSGQQMQTCTYILSVIQSVKSFPGILCTRRYLKEPITSQEYKETHPSVLIKMTYVNHTLFYAIKTMHFIHQSPVSYEFQE